jgi:hypothetical protein
VPSLRIAAPKLILAIPLRDSTEIVRTRLANIKELRKEVK